jgi:hypothetical protein
MRKPSDFYLIKGSGMTTDSRCGRSARQAGRRGRRPGRHSARDRGDFLVAGV